MELLKELGRRIQKARKEKGLTQQELADLSHVSLKHVQGCERGVKNPSFEVLRAFGKVLNLSLDSLMNLDLPEDEQAANDMRQLYLSCPPAARKVLLNSTRALADELKEMVQTAGVDPDEHLEDKQAGGGIKIPHRLSFGTMRRSDYRAVSSRRASFFSPRRMLSHTRRRSAPSIRAISATVMPR